MHDTAPQEFKVKFEEHIEALRKSNPVEYAAAFLGNIAKSRRRLPVLIIDNIDHHPHPVQEAVFQYAMTFGAHPNIPVSLIVLPVTLKTLWQLSRQTSFESYFTSRFYLPAPPPQEVVRRRLTFLQEQIDVSAKTKSAEYFLNQSIRVSLESLQRFVLHVQEALINLPHAARALEMLANGDIRRLLEITHRIMISQYVGTAELFTSFVTGEELRVERKDVLKALICMDSTAYRSDENPYIANVFEVAPVMHVSPLLGIRILSYLRDRFELAERQRKPRDREVPINEFAHYFAQMTVRKSEVAETVNAFLAQGLIEAHDPSIFTYERAESLGISSCGMLHLEWALSEPIYVEAMSEVTSIHREEVLKALESAFGVHGDKKGVRNAALARMEFAKYCATVDREFYAIPPGEAYSTQRSLSKTFEDQWGLKG